MEASDPTALPPEPPTEQVSTPMSPSRTPTPRSLSTPTPSVTPEQPAAGRVALVKTDNRQEGVTRALALLGANTMQGEMVFLKPNFNSADPAPGSTHPDTLRALVESLQGMGAKRIIVADRSGMGNTRGVMETIGVFDQAEEMGYDVLVLDELPPEEWVRIQKEGQHWERGFWVPRIMLEAGAVVQTCNLKTHRFGGHFTMSLKNSVGCVARTLDDGHDYMSELHNSPHQRAMIAEINAAYTPALIVMDGVTAFTSGGPDRGTLAETQVVLASTDPIAVDAVGVAILRLFGTTPEVSEGEIFAQEQIARAIELGLGIRAPEAVRLVTDDAESVAYAEEIGALL